MITYASLVADIIAYVFFVIQDTDFLLHAPYCYCKVSLSKRKKGGNRYSQMYTGI